MRASQANKAIKTGTIKSLVFAELYETIEHKLLNP